MAHRDPKGTRSSVGEARGDAGHGEVLAAAFRPEMEKMVTSRRLRGLWSELGGALGSQGGGGHSGQLNLMRGGSSTANLDGDEVLLLGAPVAEKRSVLAV